MNATEEAKVQYLLDSEDLRHRKALYGQLVDSWVCTKDASLLDQLIELFTDDAVADFGELMGVHEGREGIRRLFGELIPQGSAWMWHSFHSPLIKVEGDAAHVKWTIAALTAKEGPPRVVYGRYIDDYVRADGGWLQSRLTYRDETRQWASTEG